MLSFNSSSTGDRADFPSQPLFLAILSSDVHRLHGADDIHPE